MDGSHVLKAMGENWSFAAVDTDGWVSQVTEKERISDNCSVGMYWFSTAALFEEAYRGYYLDSDNGQEKEKYIAPLYNYYLIKKGKKISISQISDQMVHVLGTPEELVAFATSVG